MRKDAIYQKSPKGVQSIATRDHAVTPKLRTLLILVDGKRRCDELAKLTPADDAEQLLHQLLQMGMIEEGAVAPAAAAASIAAASAGPGPASRPAGTVSLSEAQRFAVRRLTDLLGPTAEDLCLRIEGARNATDFTAAIRSAEKILQEFKGAEPAASFAREMQSHRPA